MGDDGGPVATDAAWPDGCSPISCAERGCGTHTASCGIVVDCGPCEAARRTLELEARDLLWDASRGVLYVSVPSSQPRGNAVGAVDPLTLERTFDVIVGSEPGAMVLDEDASALYVHLEGSDSLRRVDLGRREAGLEILLEPGTFVGDMGLLPGRPESLVVSLWTGLPGAASGFSSLVVYDGATRRSDAVSFGEGNASFIEMLDASTVIGVGAGSTAFASTFTLDADGIREMSEHAIGSSVGDIALLGDLLYGETGVVIDPRSWEITRRLPASGRVAFDEASGRLYFLDIYSREERRTLVSVDLATAELRGRLELAAGAGSAWDLVVWRADGRGGVAYLEAEGNGDLRPTRLVVVETNLVVVR
jgi:hypothetical protein